MFEAFDISDAVVVNLAPALYAVVRCLTDVVTAVNAESLAYSAFAHSHTSSIFAPQFAISLFSSASPRIKIKSSA